jgi:8-oxo-dGTP diphosphatase
MVKVTCAIIVDGTKILVTQRSAQMKHPLKWEFPGGKVHDGESEEECVVREIQEELSLKIKVNQRLTSQSFNYGDRIIILIPFTAHVLAGELKLTEHKDFKWVTKEELKNFDWVPADILVLEEYLLLKKQI